MKRLAVAVGLAALAWTGQSSQELPPWVLQLARIKQNVRSHLQHLPNCVCLETVERFRALRRPYRLTKLDTLRFEIASVDGKELFALPGSGKSQRGDVWAHVGSGFIGTGTFSGFLHTLFAAQEPRFTFRGEEDLPARAGKAEMKRQALRYDFEVSSLFTGYTLTLNARSGMIGFRGSFWADAGSLDLLRMELHAIEIPPVLAEVKSSDMTMDYARVRVGRSDVLLPRFAEMLVTYASGAQERNVVELSGCREFVSESTIQFFSTESSPPGEAPAPPGTYPRSGQKK